MKRFQLIFLIALCIFGLYLNYKLPDLGVWLSAFDQDDKWIIAATVVIVFLLAWMMDVARDRNEAEKRKSRVRVGACINPEKPFWLGFKWQRSND